MEADPNAVWREYVEGHHGPERMAAAALAAEARKQGFRAERDRIANALNLPDGATPIWKHSHSVEIAGFRATLIAPAHGNRKLGTFITAEEASEAINSARVQLDVELERRIKLTQASLPQPPNKSGLPTGVIKRETKKGDRYSAVIDMTQPDGKRLQRMIGTYDSPEEAHDAYRRAHIKVHGEASRYWEQRHEL
ncbi:MAG: hypothetical protein ABTQ25_17470 [Nitrosomonas ureae]